MNNFEDTLIGRPNTLRTYKGLFQRWIKTQSEKMALEDLFIYWQNNNLHPRTIKTLLNIFCQYTDWQKKPRPTCVAKLRQAATKMIPPNPPKALSLNTANKLAKTWDKEYPQTSGLIYLGVHAGLRIGEALALEWEDVNLLKGQIQITKSLTSNRIGPTKNGKGRIVPMSKDLEQSLLKRYNYVASKGRIFNCTNVNTKLKRICHIINISPISFHILRHTFATLALESGQSIKTVSETLGHAQVSTTLNLYWNLVNTRLDLNFLEEK